MRSICQCIAVKNMNEGNFIKDYFDSDNREFVLVFENNNIKIPEACYMAHGRIYDADEDIKVCRIETV